MTSIIFVNTREKVQCASSFDFKAIGSLSYTEATLVSNDSAQASYAQKVDFESIKHWPSSAEVMNCLIIFIKT